MCQEFETDLVSTFPCVQPQLHPFRFFRFFHCSHFDSLDVSPVKFMFSVQWVFAVSYTHLTELFNVSLLKTVSPIIKTINSKTERASKYPHPYTKVILNNTAKINTDSINAGLDRKSTRLNSSHSDRSRMPSSA